jgi:hypothetical protein
MLALARVIRAITSLVVLLIVVAILLFLFSANPGNAIVKDVHDAGRWLVGPFANVFAIHKVKLALAVNWGIAALVYLIVGHGLASLIARTSRAGYRRAVA